MKEIALTACFCSSGTMIDSIVPSISNRIDEAEEE